MKYKYICPYSNVGIRQADKDRVTLKVAKMAVWWGVKWAGELNRFECSLFATGSLLILEGTRHTQKLSLWSTVQSDISHKY